MIDVVAIRPITVDDTDKIIKWRNSPSVMCNFIYRTPLTRESHVNWLETKVFTGKVSQFVIEADSLPIGSVYLRDIDEDNNKAEFGIFIGEPAGRGKGYGTLATKLILEYAFKTLHLNRVYLRVFADNISAIRCYEKSGFVQEGLFRDDVIVDGTARDMVFMSVLKREWDSGTAI